MTMIRSSLKCSHSSCWRDSNQGLWGLSSSDTNQAASPAAAAGGSSWWLLPGWWNNETGRSAKIGRWQGGCRGGGGVFGGSTAEAKQKGKHVCRGNQWEGRLTTRACQRTKPAHKHGDYASESERRVTDKRNNAIKPFWSFIKVLLKKKKENVILPGDVSWKEGPPAGISVTQERHQSPLFFLKEMSALFLLHHL